MIEKAECSEQENKSGCAPRGTKSDSQRLGATEVSWPAERTSRHVASQVESGGYLIFTWIVYIFVLLLLFGSSVVSNSLRLHGR